MRTVGDRPAPSPDPPDPLLVGAGALVYVGDLSSPVLDVGQVHHLLDVLRLQDGDAVAACDGAGSWIPCRLVAARHQGPSGRGRDVHLEASDQVRTSPRARPEITVAFAPTKGDRPEWVVQKLTEVGVDRIVPLRTARSVVRWEGERALKAVDRLRRIAAEAAAQCRRPWLPEVTGLSTLAELSTSSARLCLAQFGGRAPSLDTPVVAVGPEGGWDEEELTLCTDWVGLGSTVLRAETAALTAGVLLSAIRSRLALPPGQPLRYHAP